MRRLTPRNQGSGDPKMDQTEAYMACVEIAGKVQLGCGFDRGDRMVLEERKSEFRSLYFEGSSLLLQAQTARATGTLDTVRPAVEAFFKKVDGFQKRLVAVTDRIANTEQMPIPYGLGAMDRDLGVLNVGLMRSVVPDLRQAIDAAKPTQVAESWHKDQIG
jgi:hypothetical protein